MRRSARLFPWAASALALAATAPLQAQDGRVSPAVLRHFAAAPSDSLLVWVFFDDPPRTPAPALAQRSLARRLAADIPVRASDHALAAQVTQSLESAGARPRLTSRWLGAVSAWIDAASLDSVAALPGVSRVLPVAGMAAASLASDTIDPAEYGALYDELAQLRIPEVHALGFTGLGVLVAMLDSGYDVSHPALAGLPVLATRDFIQGDDVVSNEPGDHPAQWDHGTAVWSVVGGNDPGQLIGGAFGASFLLAKVDDFETEPRADEDRWVAALEWADSLGAEIVSSSLAYRTFDNGFAWPYDSLNGDITPTTVAADAAAARGLLIVNAAGNRGPNLMTLDAPADADSILAVAAVDAAGQPAGFSSRGPTADGRIKPDIAARGVAVAGADAGGAGYVALNGTSLATPLISAAAALVLEAWPELRPVTIRRSLQLAGSSARAPDNAVGHGVPDVLSAVAFPLGIQPITVTGVVNGELTTLAPTYSWDAPLVHTLARPVTYTLQLATDSSFADIVVTDSIVDAAALTPATPPPAATALWWRVVASSPIGVERATVASGPLAMPEWVRLLTLDSPAGEFIQETRPVLEWAPLPAPPPVGPLTYRVQVMSERTGAPVVTVPQVQDTFVQVPEPLEFNEPYRWRVIATTASGAVDTITSAGPFVVTSTGAPPATLLYQNFPNPFPNQALGASTTRVWFDLAERTTVTLTVHDLQGRVIRRLIPDAASGCAPAALEPGVYGRADTDPCVRTEWDGRDDRGRRVPAGVYLLRLVAGGRAEVRRIVYLPGS